MSVVPTPAEVAVARPGDDLVVGDVALDRGFDLPAPPGQVWPWLLQLGKDRGGWYLPWSVERLLPPVRRAARRLAPELAGLRVGDTIADWGGADATLSVTQMEQPHLLLLRSQRGRATVTWCLTLTSTPHGTRVHSRVRIGPVRRPWLALSVGDRFDELTIAGLAAGLRERLS